MTATPIPRTLSMTVYGDLDLSVIDEMPPGRTPVRTRVAPESRRAEVYDFVRREVAKGRQAYVVYPLVEESEKLELRAAAEMAEHAGEGGLPRPARGPPPRPDAAGGEGARDGGLRRAARPRCCVCTTVIEVGIDVPNATVMVVEHAERFGLSQLHQLRGRVGRGAHASTCILLVAGAGRARTRGERLRVMEETEDGFRIAEEDLLIRGPGDFLGTRQAGLPDFRVGNILRDGAAPGGRPAHGPRRAGTRPRAFRPGPRSLAPGGVRPVGRQVVSGRRGVKPAARPGCGVAGCARSRAVVFPAVPLACSPVSLPAGRSRRFLFHEGKDSLRSAGLTLSSRRVKV